MSTMSLNDIANLFRDDLNDLTTNDRWQIQTLTVIARDHIEAAHEISEVLEKHIRTVSSFVMYTALTNASPRVETDDCHVRRPPPRESCLLYMSWILSSRTLVALTQYTSAVTCTLSLWTPTPSLTASHARRWSQCYGPGKTPYQPWTRRPSFLSKRQALSRTH